MKRIQQYIIHVCTMLICGCTQDITEQQTQEHDINTSQQHYYWEGNNKRYLEVDDSYWVLYQQMPSYEKFTKTEDIKATPYKLNFVSQIPSIFQNTLWTKCSVKNIDLVGNVLYSAPYYKIDNGKSIGLTNVFYIKLNNEADIDKLEYFSSENKVYFKENLALPNWYTLFCTNESSGNALELCNKAKESKLFAETDVEFVNDITIADDYNDPLFPTQWSLYYESQYGINFNDLHKLSKGHSNVKVAVIDTGFKLDHEDLSIGFGWDATSRNSIARLYDYVDDAWYSHGTATAGIINAKINNEKGVVGIAPNVSTFPISVKFNEQTNTISTNNVDSSSALAWALRQATISDAWVISNSWSSSCYHSQIDESVKLALNAGRLGKGAVVVFASGNDYSNINKYPHATNADILSVGSTTITGAKSPFSNYGIHLDIVAPGTNIKVLDVIEGYTYRNGTSYSCPHVAGVAALILSVNPSLTAIEVNDIIESTATKLPAYNFSHTVDRPNGTWNEEVGYGLVNAYKAVAMATPSHIIANQTISTDKQYRGRHIEANNIVVNSDANLELNTMHFNSEVVSGIEVNGFTALENSSALVTSGTTAELLNVVIKDSASVIVDSQQELSIETINLADNGDLNASGKSIFIHGGLEVALGSSLTLDIN